MVSPSAPAAFATAARTSQMADAIVARRLQAFHGRRRHRPGGRGSRRVRIDPSRLTENGAQHVADKLSGMTPVV